MSCTMLYYSTVNYALYYAMLDFSRLCQAISRLYYIILDYTTLISFQELGRAFMDSGSSSRFSGTGLAPSRSLSLGDKRIETFKV